MENSGHIPGHPRRIFQPHRHGVDRWHVHVHGEHLAVAIEDFPARPLDRDHPLVLAIGLDGQVFSLQDLEGDEPGKHGAEADHKGHDGEDPACA